MKLEERFSFVKSLPIFSKLEDEIIAEIAAKMVLRRYPQGKMLFFQKEPGETLFFIQRGLVKIFALSEDGREKTLTLLEEGDAFGEMSLLDQMGRSANAQALQDSILFLLYKKDFLQILSRHSELAYQMLYILVHRLRDADRQIAELAFKSTRQRIALLLLRLARKYGKEEEGYAVFNLSLSQEEIGHLTGCTRESVNRTFHRLSENGVFDLCKERYRVKIDGLEKLIAVL